MERRKFTREFKIEAVKFIQERGVTVAQAVRDLGVHGTVWRRWVLKSTADVQQAFPGQGQVRPEAVLHHSDQGSQYTGEPFQRLLADHGVTCSIAELATLRTMPRWRASSPR